MKRTLTTIAAVALTIGMTSALANINQADTASAKATGGFRIFNTNKSASDSITTSNPDACQGVSFPTPIAGNSNAVVKVQPSFVASGKVCSTQYHDTTGNDCLVSIRSPLDTGKTEMYATPIVGYVGTCNAINENTAVAMHSN